MNININDIPITPALIAFGNASAPNWAPTFLTDTALTVTGSAPELMIPDNFVASSIEDIPLITAFPSVIALWTTGCDTTSLSIDILIVFPILLAVASANFACPSSFNSNDTTGLDVSSRIAVASLTSLPVKTTLPSGSLNSKLPVLLNPSTISLEL